MPKLIWQKRDQSAPADCAETVEKIPNYSRDAIVALAVSQADIKTVNLTTGSNIGLIDHGEKLLRGCSWERAINKTRLSQTKM